MSDAIDCLDRASITWQCPHCREVTSDSEQGVRTHINNADDGSHEGASGRDLEHHIPGYNSDGHLAAAIRASTTSLDEAIVPATAIHNSDWHQKFATMDESTSTVSSNLSQLASDDHSLPSDEVHISVDALDEIQTILAHHREAGKRAEQLANPGSVPAARAQARWYTAGRFIEILDNLYEDTDDRPAQAGHDRER